MQRMPNEYTTYTIAERRAMRAARRRKKKLLQLAVISGAVLIVVLIIMGARALLKLTEGARAAAKYGVASYDLSGYVFDAQDPNLVLVNSNNPLSDAYVPETVVADDATGKTLAPDAAAAFRQMVAAAENEKISLVMCSGYRDFDYQADLFAKRKQKYLDQGMDEAKADATAKTIVAKPGTSEHQTGLAVDIVTEKYTSLDTGFAETKAFAWLVRYAPEYGFILRYPEGHEAATGIVYEPWHWRYVGVENAKAITASGLSLEEFLALHITAADLTA